MFADNKFQLCCVSEFYYIASYIIFSLEIKKNLL